LPYARTRCTNRETGRIPPITTKRFNDRADIGMNDDAADLPFLLERIRQRPFSKPFIGPEALARDHGTAITARIGANESPFGPSPHAISAYHEAIGEVWKYPDPDSRDLREAIASLYGLAASNVVVGEGIDGLLGAACALCLDTGQTAVTSLGAYPTFTFLAELTGATLVRVPYRDDREDLMALAEAASHHNPGIVYLANPDNPMGLAWPAADVVDFRKSLPETCLLLLDEAYAETASDCAKPASADLLGQPNLLRLRTFSKAYGLAGARIGYALGAPSLIRQFEKVRNHYGINRPAQAAALAAIRDQDYLADVVSRISAGREQIAAIASRNGLKPLPSAANFVAVDCLGDGALARRILQELLQLGVFVRMPAVPPLDRCIRVSVGTAQELAVLEEALPVALSRARQS